MKKFLQLVLLTTIITSSVFFSYAQPTYAAESYNWPTSGWIGDFRYKSQTSYCTGYCHTGIDIWNNYDGGWNNGVSGQSNSIYGVYPGYLYYEDVNGYYIKNTNNLFSIFYHVRDRQLTSGQYVDSNTYIGNQDTDGGKVHLHFSVSTAAGDAYSIDPSPYFGVQLDVTQPNVIGSLTLQVQAGNGSCGGVNVVKSNWDINGSNDCSASNSITVNPNSQLNPGSGVIRLHIQ